MSNSDQPLGLGCSEGLGPQVADIQAAMRRFANAYGFLGNRQDRGPADEALSQAINAYRHAAVAAERERWQHAMRCDSVCPPCREVAEELHNLAWALSLPGFDRMATDEQEAEHQAGLQRVNDMLARMEKAKADHDAAMADAARFRWLDEVALSVDMVADPDNLVQVWHSYVTPDKPPTTGRTLREAVDEAMKRHNVGVEPVTPATEE